MTRVDLGFITALILASVELSGCGVKANPAEVQGRWVLQSKSGSAKGAEPLIVPTLDLAPDFKFHVSAMPCRMVPFGCPDGGEKGDPIDGEGSWRIVAGNLFALRSETSPYTKLFLKLRMIKRGGVLVPYGTEASLVIDKGKEGIGLYKEDSDDLELDPRWVRVNSITSK